MQVGASGALEPEAAQLAEARHRLARPGEEVALTVRDPEQVPDDLFEVIRIGNGDDQHAARLQDAMHVRQGAERVGHVLQHFEAEHEVIGAGGERDPLRNVVDQDIGTGERGVDLDPLVAHVLREHAAQAAVARADVEHGRAGGHAGQGRRPAKPHPLLRRGVPGGTGDVELGEVAGIRHRLVGHGRNLRGTGGLTMARGYYVGDWAVGCGPLFPGTPFNYAWKGLDLYYYGKWLKQALESGGPHEGADVPAGEVCNLR